MAETRGSDTGLGLGLGLGLVIEMIELKKGDKVLCFPSSFKDTLFLLPGDFPRAKEDGRLKEKEECLSQKFTKENPDANVPWEPSPVLCDDPAVVGS